MDEGLRSESLGPEVSRVHGSSHKAPWASKVIACFFPFLRVEVHRSLTKINSKAENVMNFPAGDLQRFAFTVMPPKVPLSIEGPTVLITTHTHAFISISGKIAVQSTTLGEFKQETSRDSQPAIVVGRLQVASARVQKLQHF